MLKYLILLTSIAFLQITHVHAQIGGLSASKLSAVNTETVPQYKIEFEPSFIFSYAKHYWDNHAKSRPLFKNNDSLQVNSEMDFRFTYGLAPHWEAGFSLPTDVSYLSLGSKFRFLEKANYSLAILNGVNLPLGNHVYHAPYRHSMPNEYDVNLLLGMAATYQFEKQFSVDLNGVFQGHLDKGSTHLGRRLDAFFFTDFGYYLIQGFQAVIGIYYYKSYGNQQKLTLNPGFTVEKAKNFILVMNFPYDVWGKSCEKQFGLGFALTIVLE